MSEAERTDTWDFSAGSMRGLQEKLSDHFGVEEVWHEGDFFHEERDELLYEVLIYWDGDQQHFIADDVPVYGHGPSGAVGCWEADLPDEETVHAVVEVAQNGSGEGENDG